MTLACGLPGTDRIFFLYEFVPFPCAGAPCALFNEELPEVLWCPPTCSVSAQSLPYLVHWQCSSSTSGVSADGWSRAHGVAGKKQRV